MNTFVVTEQDTSRAWAAACRKLDQRNNSRRDGFHTIVRIADAASDDLGFRAELDRIRAHCGCQPIETIANTIFPARMATSTHTPEALVARYRNAYSTLRRLDKANVHGTYFGRIVEYPGPEGAVDQLGKLIDRLRKQASNPGPLSAAYELSLAEPEEDGLASDATAEVHIHKPGRDNLVRGFPCLSHCSFQLEHGQTVHAVAYYRSHYMVDRAYGNYLGLGRLLTYVATQAGLKSGALTVIAGHAQIEGSITAIRQLLGGPPVLPAA